MVAHDFERLRCFAFHSESLEAAVANSREEVRKGDAAHVVLMFFRAAAIATTVG